MKKSKRISRMVSVVNSEGALAATLTGARGRKDLSRCAKMQRGDVGLESWVCEE